MDSRLKQRLIGALVLTAVAIVIVPTLLDGSAEDRERVIASIPDAPVIPVETMSVQEIRRRMEAMERASAAQMPTEVVDENEYEEDFTLDKNSLPVSWSLQLASFEVKNNATALREKLRQANHHSYVIHSKTSEGELYRVFIGPMIKKSALVELASDIEKQFKLKGQVVRYRIEDDAGQVGG